MEFLLLIVTLVFVFYLLYVVFSAKKEPQEAAPPTEPQAGAAKASVKGAVSHAVGSAQARSSISRPERAAAADNDSESAPPTEGPKVERLRDPETGEIAPSPTNYRFAKRWIKEALVREGLLDRIYKPNEIDEAVGRKVRDALARLKAMDKYQA